MLKLKTLGLSMMMTMVTFLVTPVSIIGNQVNAEPFQPKVEGAPSRRVGGGTRGTTSEIPSLVALSTENVGKTNSAQPTLLWSVSKAIKKPFKFTLIYADPFAVKPPATEPVKEVVIKDVVDGVQMIDLAGYGVTLQPNIEYEWSISIIMGNKEGSGDISATGSIVYTPDKELSAAVAKADEKQHPSMYQKAGYWYDAMAELSKLVAKHPEDATLRQQRATLLQQVNLEKVVAYNK
jgi:hypothetical protein